MKAPKIDKTIKKGRVLKWTFQSVMQSMLKSLGELGQSNARIKLETKGAFTDNEINYALAKAQRVEGFKGGYRRRWANGESELCQRVKRDLLSVLIRDNQRKLPVQILHPETQTVKVDE